MRSVIVQTQREVAAVFGVTTNTIKSSWRQNGMPGPTKCGGWDLVAVGEWQRGRDAAGVGVADVRRRKLASEVRVASARAARLEMIVADQDRLLIPATEARARADELVRRVSERVDRVPAEIVAHIPKAKRRAVRKATRSYIASVLTELRDWHFACEPPSVTDDGGSATTQPDIHHPNPTAGDQM